MLKRHTLSSNSSWAASIYVCVAREDMIHAYVRVRDVFIYGMEFVTRSYHMIYVCVNEARPPDRNESLALYINESRTLSRTQNVSLILCLAPRYELVHI